MATYQRTLIIASHLVVYLLLAALSGIWRYPEIALISLILMGVLIWISVSDFETMRIPDPANLLLVLSGLLATWYLNSEGVLSNIIAAIVWAAVFWGVGRLYLHIRNRPGLGLGDAKLMAGAGAWLGIYGPVSVVLIASVAGILASLTLSSFNRNSGSAMQSAIAFGPFLSLSLWSVWLFGLII